MYMTQWMKLESMWKSNPWRGELTLKDIDYDKVSEEEANKLFALTYKDKEEELIKMLYSLGAKAVIK